MKQTNFKKIFWVVLAIVMAVSILPISAIASGNRQDSLTWTEAPASVTLQPGETVGGELKYKLTLSPELLKTLSDGENSGVSLSLQLPEGIQLPVSQADEITISEDGSSLLYNDENGKHHLIPLSIDTGWAIRLSPQSLSFKEAGSKGENSNLAFFIELKKKTQENPTSSPAADTKPEESARDNGENTNNDTGTDNTSPTNVTDEAQDSITPSDSTDAPKDSITPSESTEEVNDNTVTGNNEEEDNTAETPTGDAAVNSPDTTATGDADTDSPDTAPTKNAETDSADTAPNNDVQNSAPVTTTPDPNQPVTLTVTIPAGVLKADETFQGGKITLTAQVGEVTAKAETTAELKESVAAATPRGTTESRGFKVNIFWVDNHNEEGNRMSPENMAAAVTEGITCTVDGKPFPLTPKNMEILGMEALPQATVTDNGVNAYTLSYPDNAFPTELEDEEGNTIPVTWSFSQPECDGYDAVEVTEKNIDNYPSIKKNESPYGWYYILKAPFSFDVVLRSGASYNGTNGESGNLNRTDLQEAVLKNFTLVIERPGNEKLINLPLETIEKDSNYDFTFEVGTGGDAEDAPEEADQTATITVNNGWKYNINGERMLYRVLQTDATAPITAPKIENDDAPGGVGEDTLKITYDNTGTLYASETDAAWQGGKLILTLTGEAAYNAKKVWQDQGVENVERPTATLELWRYRNGQDLESAAPVRDKDNKIVQMELNNESSEQQIKFSAENPNIDSLPKYDSDGYRYVYVVKEYLTRTNADKYQQVFGEITEEPEGSGNFIIKDTLPDWLPEIEGTTTTRTENNNYLYNGGTLSNCLDVNRKVEATKTWKAATFQADFENVIVELTLESRPQTEDNDGKWSPATDENGQEIKRVKYGFSEEELAAWDVNATVPKYGLLGRVLEYRWVETAVYQPEDITGEEALKTWYETNATEAHNLLNGNKFELQQNTRPVAYKSTTKTSEENNDHQTITNALDNTINYTVIKKWEGINPQEVSFSIFRIPSGEALDKNDDSYLTFTMDENGKVKNGFEKPDDAPNLTITEEKD